MKRRTLKFIACAAVMALTLSVTACGGSDDKTADTEVKTTEDVAETEEEPEAEPEVEDETEVEDEVEEETEDEEDAETEDEADADTAEDASDATYETLEDYYNDPSVKEALDSAYASMAEEGTSLSIEVSGNEFIVIMKFEDRSLFEGIDDMSVVSEGLDQALDSLASIFETAASQFDEEIGQKGACTVTVRYTDPDDNVLSQKSFTAN